LPCKPLPGRRLAVLTFPSALALFMTGILADNPDNPRAPNNPAVVANFLN